MDSFAQTRGGTGIEASAVQAVPDIIPFTYFCPAITTGSYWLHKHGPALHQHNGTLAIAYL